MKLIEPKIAVIIVSRNRKFFLEELLLCLNNQVFKEFEIIIIENASNYETRSFVEKIECTKNNVKKIFLEKEATVSYCRNIPFRNNLIASSVEYVYFIDDDDYIFKNTLQVLYEKISKTKAQVVFCNHLSVVCDGKLHNNVLKNMNYFFLITMFFRKYWLKIFGSSLYKKNKWLINVHLGSISIHSVIIEKEIAFQNKFNDLRERGEDTIYWLEMGRSIKKFESIPNFFVIYRRHKNNTSNKYFNDVNYPLSNSIEFCKIHHYSSTEIYMVLYYIYLKNRRLQFKSWLMNSAFDKTFIRDFKECALQVTTWYRIKTKLFYIFPIMGTLLVMITYLFYRPNRK